MENQKKATFPAQHQNRQPGKESEMIPQPVFDNPNYKGSNKLLDKVAIITGGDSGIGRAIAIAYAKEGANIVIIHLKENDDANTTKLAIESIGKKCLVIEADLSNEQTAFDAVNQTIKEYGKIDILVNNAAVQFPQNYLTDITSKQLIDTFESNIYSYFYMSKAVIPHFSLGCNIINTTSITAFKGHETLIDYSATKGAIVSFTRSLSLSLVKQGIRVNAIAPGPIWTPLIVSSFSANEVSTFGSTTPMGRAGQPYELAPAYVFLASDDSSFISGEIIHINGGQVIN